jgi:hypothetical protein
MRQIRRGLALTGQSWRVLRAHRELTVFPLVGAVCIFMLAGPVFVPGAYLADRGDTVPGVALIAAATYLASFLTTFFGVALAAAADKALRGEDPSVRDGLRLARTRLGPIAGWALVTATVSMVIRAVESQRGIGQIVSAVLGAAWGVISFLVIPLVALEGIGPIEGLKRSAGLFKQHWGGQLTGMAAVGIGVFFIGVLPSLALLAGGVAVLSSGGSAGVGGGAVLVGLGAVGFGISMLVGTSLRQVFAVALYRYTLDGQTPAGFSAADLEGAVRTR